MSISEKKNPEKVLVGSRNNYVNLFDLMYICIWYNALPGVKIDGVFPGMHRLPPALQIVVPDFHRRLFRKPVEYLSIGNPYFRKQLTMIYALTLFHGLSTINIAMRKVYCYF